MSSRLNTLLHPYGAFEADPQQGYRFKDAPKIDAAIPEQTYVSPQTDYALIKCTGPDAVKFIQGQVSCDVQGLAIDASSLGSHCTPKGRMLSSFRAFCPDDNTVLLKVRRDIAAELMQDLGKYMVFSKAELEDVSEHYHFINCFGRQARQQLSENFGIKISNTQNHISTSKDGYIIQIDEAGEAFELLINSSSADTEAVLKLASLANSRHWQAILIGLGIAEVSQSSRDAYIPQMLNMEQLGGISFSKGCYTGQEIIARAKYRGQLKRAMFRGQTLSSQSPSENVDIIGVDTSDHRKTVGQVISAQQLGNGYQELLMVINIEAATSSTLYLSNVEDDAIIQRLPLPYAITNDAS